GLPVSPGPPASLGLLLNFVPLYFKQRSSNQTEAVQGGIEGPAAWVFCNQLFWYTTWGIWLEWFWIYWPWWLYRWIYWQVVTVTIPVVRITVIARCRQLILAIAGLVKGGLTFIFKEMFLTVFDFDVNVTTTTYRYTLII
ncbi:MAG: hypothetical protein KGJ11_09495, partial [Candidatus Omnitrophica bacterium]|nr:hypothetical protein [Candidatus Omnitrophota bacterium]